MYITPRQKKRYIITSLIIAVAIPLTVLAGYYGTQLLSRAGDEQPQEVIVSNLTTNSVTLTWTTPIDSVGTLTLTAEGSQPVLDSRGGDSRKTHFVELLDLEPDTQYSFKITSNGVDYTTDGTNPFTFKTLAVTDESPVPNPTYGNIPGVGSDALIFLVVNSPVSSLPISAYPQESGNWILDLSALRTLDGTGSIQVASDSEISILVQGPDGMGVIKTATYSEIFGENGRQLETVDLTLTEGTSIYASVPDEAKIGTLVAQDDGGSDNGDDSGTDDGTVPPPTDDGGTDDGTVPPPTDDGGTDNGDDSGTDDGTVPPPTDDGGTDDGSTPPPDDNEFDPSTRQFILTSDISWNNLVTGSVVVSDPPDVDTGPDTVEVVGLTDTGFVIIWMTEEPVEGYVEYGTFSGTLGEEAIDVRDSQVDKGEYYAHIIEITDLNPETTYYYQIISGDDTFDNNGTPFTVETFSTLNSPPPFSTATGSVLGLDDYSDVVVIAQIEDVDSTGTSGISTKVAVVPDSSGNWIASIGDLRNEDGTEYFSTTDGDEITVSVLVYANSDPVTEVTDDLDNTNIEIEAVAPEPVSSYQRVQLLANYGLSSTLSDGVGGAGDDSTDSSTDDGNTDSTTDGSTSGGTTPNTAISEPLLYAVITGSVTILLGVGVWLIGSSGKTAKSSTMSGSV